MYTRTFGLVVSIVAGPFLGCAVDVGGGETSARTEPIFNGVPVANDTLGVVALYSSCGGCTGTLLMNDWVLSARHCFDCDPTGSVTAVHGPTGASRESRGVFLHDSLDVALVRLQTPFAFSGGTTQPPASINNRIYDGYLSTLPGNTVRVDGYGKNTCFEGFGSLRTANLVVDSVGSSDIFLRASAIAQIQYSGDSGGPVWYTQGGTTYVAGVTRAVDTYCTDTDLPEWSVSTGGAAVANWANRRIISREACGAGRAECDGNYASLCETDTSTSTSHCGECGNRCAAGSTCAGGVCRTCTLDTECFAACNADCPRPGRCIPQCRAECSVC